MSNILRMLTCQIDSIFLHFQTCFVFNRHFNFQTFFFEDLESKFLSEAGVNMDEELANMTIFQNAYNASARLVQTIDEMLETLLSIT